MAYTRFSEIEFPEKQYATICKNMMLDIQTLETQVMLDQEYDLFLKTAGISDTTSLINHALAKEILYSLKTAFWYYSGKDPSFVILDQKTSRGEKPVDIFKPLGDK
jgi:hypothetical protein